MADEDEWKKLSTENKVQHKSWKARAEGYKECIKNFKMWDEKSGEFSKYLGLMKKFVIDTNELIRVQGLEATLVFVENAHVAPKTCGEVVSGVMTKCFSAKAKHKALGIDVCLMYIERDHNEQTQEELLKGVDNKNPKIVSACLETLTTALSLFGSKVISVKPILKQTPKLLNHRDKDVREKTKELYIETYRWIGQAIRTPLQNINAIILKELEEDWEKIGNEKSTQSRFMRSQQDLKEKAESAELAASAVNDEAAGTEKLEDEIDPYDLLDAVEILSKLPKDFYQKIEEKKWQERKGVLEVCLKLSETPKMESGDYGDLMRSLKKVVTKDTNVMLVTIAVKCVTGFANGLRKKFQPYATSFIDAFIEKFKEKKVTVVKALQDGIDAVYKTTTLQTILETVIEGLQNKNPVIREQTSLFLARALNGSKVTINKPLVKSMCVPLLANIDHSSPGVREGSYETLGALLKRVGEKILNPYLADIDKIKMDKISEFAGKIKDTQENNKSISQKAPVKAVKPAEKTKSAGTKTTSKKKSANSNKKPQNQKPIIPKKVDDTPPAEPELSETAIEDLLAEFLSDEIQKKITNMNWKERLEGLQQATQKIKMSEKANLPCQAVVFLLGNGKPGWSDSNFNCLNAKFDIIKLLAEFGNFSRTAAKLCLKVLTDKIGDIKCGNASKAALTAIAECCLFPWVAEEILERSMSQKNPKIQSESLVWLSDGIKAFGMNKVNVKLLIAKIKLAIAATNPAVRNAAFALVGTLALYVGEKIKMFFDGEKAAVVQQISSEVDKVSGQTAPTPTRGIQTKSESTEADDGEDEEPATSITDLIPRVDVSLKLTDLMLQKLGDKNWKTRREGLEEVAAVITEGKFIESALGDLPDCLKLRLGDSNKVLVTNTLNLMGQIAVALGPHCKVHVKTFISSLYKVLSDSKPLVRQAALNTMNQWLENTQISVWFEDDAVGSALQNSKYVFLRVELLNWMTEKLLACNKISSIAKDNLEASIKHLCSCCEDRNADVRTKAQAALPAYIYHLGLDKMMRVCGKHSSNANSILALLEAANEKVPARKINKPKPAQQIKIDIPEDEPTEKPKVSPKESCKGDSNTENVKPKSKLGKTAKVNKKPAAAQKSDNTAPISEILMNISNSKEQRIKDEAKLKTLKWIFQSPREELVMQLKTQCSTCMGTELLTEMFHNDFQHHIKAISMLTSCLKSSWPACVSTFDLQLRWITLRFYETNTTVHIKCIEFVKSAFEHLDSENIRLTDYEANSFIPHLIIKIGENKDNIRKGVHSIIQLIGKVYPASKIFTHLMTGLVSKNSRQRTECLDELSILISNHGIDVCQPSPPKALKEIATHIGDRDKGVRSAALNVIVEAYNVCGEVVHKYVGKLSDKDRGMLEERIKRSGKYLPAEQNDKPATVSLPPKENNPPENVKKQFTSKVKLNTSDLHSSGNQKNQENQFNMPELLDTNSDELLNFDPQLPPELLAKIEGFFSYSSKENNETTLNDVIIRMANKDFTVSLKAVHQLNAIWKDKEQKHLLKDKMDQVLLVTAACMRHGLLKYLNKEYIESINSNVNIFYKSLIWLTTEIVGDKEFAVLLSSMAIEDIIQANLLYMTDTRWSSKDLEIVGNAYIHTINKMILHIFMNCDVNNLLSALLRLFGKTSSITTESYEEVLRRGIWRVVALRCGEANTIPKNIVPVLKEINVLFTLLAQHPILKKKSNVSTLKTIVTRFCDKIGASIVEQVNQIEGNKTELAILVDKEMVKRGFGVSVDRHSAPISSLKENDVQLESMSLEARLSAIFKKIGDREQTKIGLEHLYNFKKENPFYDIEPEISGVSPLFRNYITRGLDNIEQQKLKNVNYHASKVKLHSAQEHLARLDLLKAKCGINTSVDTHKPVLTANTSALNQASDDSESIKSSVKPPSTKPVLQRPSTAPTRTVKMSNNEDLKRRLEKIRNNTSRKMKS